MSILANTHKYLLSITSSVLVLAAHSSIANAQQINNSGSQGHITVSGPTYTDVMPGGGESIVSSGAGNSVTVLPTSGRVTAGSVRIEAGGGMNATNTDFTGGSRTGAAVLARDQYSGGAFINLTNSTITTVESLKESRALEARHTNKITMTGGSITSRLFTTLDPTGVLAWSGGSLSAVGDLATIILKDVQIFVSDIANTKAGTGIRSVDGGQISATDTTVIVGHTTNTGNVGLHSMGASPKAGHVGASSLITATDSTITVHGHNSFGALLTGTGDLEADNTDFTLTGDDSIGISAQAGSEAQLNNVSILTSGANSTGLKLAGSAIVSLTDSDVTSNGNIASFVPMAGSTSLLEIDNSTLDGETGIFDADAGYADIWLTNVNTVTDGTLLTVNNSGDVMLTASHSSLNGDIIVDASSDAHVLLNDSTILTGAAESAVISIDGTSRWNITDDSNLTVLNNAGEIAFSAITGDPAQQANYSTLTTDDYNASGGTIYFNTHLGDDASATDRLIITGDVNGTTTVKVLNTGGPGAQTVEGIELIQATDSTASSFALAGDYSLNGQQAVVGGAYAYRLHQGNSSGSNDTDWFLRSELLSGEPEYQTGAPVYEAYPQALLGLNSVSTLQQRVGNRSWAGNGNNVIAQGADAIGAPYAAPEEAGTAIEGNGLWMRMEGGYQHIKSATSTTDTDYNQNVFKLQAGFDGVLSETENGKLLGGIMLQYVHGKTKTNSNDYADGEISTDGYGFGGTLTWYNDNGFYVDGQAQVTWYKSDLTTTALGAPTLSDGNKGLGYTVSLETGKRIAIDPEWSMTPQAQLIYSHVDFDDFTDGFGSAVSLNKGESVQGRLGLTLDHQKSWQNANGMINRSHVYGITNLYYEFMNGTKADIAGVSFANKKDRLWGGLGVGGSYNWDNDKYSIYGEGLVNTSLNNFGDSYSLKGNVGFRVKW